MVSKIWSWLNARWPLSALIRLSMEEEIPGGSRFAYTLGSCTLIVFLLQAVTGIFQLFYYVPTTDQAYNSLLFFWTQVPFGWLVHGLHYWGANAMVVLVCLHVGRVFIWGAYKSPRELTWLLGVCLLVTVMGLSFTGGPLPWNQKAYWEAEVGTSIPGSIPLIGDWVKTLVRGGEVLGQLTLSRFFIVHTAILPSILLVLIGAHLIAFRMFGSVGPWIEAHRERSGPFWPDQVFKDALMATFIVLILTGLSAFSPPPILGPADPLDISYQPKPDWPFLFLYQGLKYFPGKLEPVGTAGIPILLILLLIIPPLLDRRPERNPIHRPIAITCGLMLAGIITALTLVGAFSQPGTTQVSPPPAATPARQAIPSSSQPGAQLLQSQGCTACHKVNGVGGTLGPDLSAEANRGRSRGWLATQIQNPKAHNPKSIMPAFTSLTHRQLNSLLDYLLSPGAKAAPQPAKPAPFPQAKPEKRQKPSSSPSEAPPALPSANPPSTHASSSNKPGPAAAMIGSADRGADLYKEECASCHGPRGTDQVPNPGSEEGKVPPLSPIDRELFSSDPQIFAEKIDAIIQHGSVPAGPNPALKMAAFGDSNDLSPQQIANIEAYILRLNGVDRAQLVNPGMAPRTFFLLIALALMIPLLFLGGIYRCLPTRPPDPRQ
jgi:ubiquinol-cytochrome c reductase cytochrome b subunit